MSGKKKVSQKQPKLVEFNKDKNGGQLEQLELMGFGQVEYVQKSKKGKKRKWLNNYKKPLSREDKIAFKIYMMEQYLPMLKGKYKEMLQESIHSHQQL